jgi:hypothetical protein
VVVYNRNDGHGFLKSGSEVRYPEDRPSRVWWILCSRKPSNRNDDTKGGDDTGWKQERKSKPRYAPVQTNTGTRLVEHLCAVETESKDILYQEETEEWILVWMKDSLKGEHDTYEHAQQSIDSAQTRRCDINAYDSCFIANGMAGSKYSRFRHWIDWTSIRNKMVRACNRPRCHIRRSGAPV